uniref:Transmembrane protein n=1 Tax=Mesocestoides corti TaxID=53468 RepID=A0A5K3G3X1_MESCO
MRLSLVFMTSDVGEILPVESDLPFPCSLVCDAVKRRFGGLIRCLRYLDSLFVLSVRLTEGVVDIFLPANSPQPSSSVSWSALEFSRLIGIFGQLKEEEEDVVVKALSTHLAIDDDSFANCKLRSVFRHNLLICLVSGLLLCG